MPRPGEKRRATERRLVVLVVAVGAVARAVVAAVVPLTSDEAYYVDWARHLAPGYLDHPPLVAWLIAGPLAAFGHHTLAVRAPAIALQAAATLLGASVVRRWAGDRAALRVAVLLQAAPVFSLGALLMTPDAPLAFGWIGSLWALERACAPSEPDPPGKGSNAERCAPRWFVVAGAFLGVAALSKLTAGLLAVGVLASLVATPAGRGALRTPWPWVGAAVAVALASPMLAWNALHGWPSFRFQAHHGMSGRTFEVARLGQSIAAQAAYVSPVLLVLCVAAAARALTVAARWPGAVGRSRSVSHGGGSSPSRVAAALTALPLIAFFTVAAAFTPGALPHWPAPGWLSALLLLAAAGSRWTRPAVWTGGAIVLALLVAVAVPLPMRTPLDELHGWSEAVGAARRIDPHARLATTHWIALGHLGWYAQEPLAYVSDRVSAPTYYARRPDARPLLVIVADGLGPPRAKLEELLGPLEERGRVTAVERGRAVRSYGFYAPVTAAPTPSASRR